MLTRLHANATTTPKVRAEIQASSERVAVLAARYGVSETTIRRWRRRTGTEDRSHVRHNLGQATSPVEEAIIAELRTLAGLSLDDITEVMNRCVNPKLSRGSVWRALRRAGLSGRQRRGAAPGGTPGAPGDHRARPQRFEDAAFGFVHVDLKYLAKLGGRSEFVFVAIERRTRFVWVEIVPGRGARAIAATMARFLEAFPGGVHTVLTDNGSEFTDRFGGHVPQRTGRPSGRHPFDRLCAARGIEHRLTRPYTPKTNGMVERFNRRLGEAIEGHARFRDDPHRRGTFASHAERTAFILDFVEAYNRTRLRCLAYQAPLDALTNQLGDNTQRRDGVRLT
ncbi:DDE-type integrase/transposase/recombinase [uncultured Amaricoccus sp.]|uniref:DDE-type integrase/transposase/recombinase n=1 Tax=uncultured Amaricoccus sp. TaxID=339341 RepID=UPI0026265342|nr:DDE-type integrase/transposase/recombinase [uncultured Amaricoccus sp.]